ncbi:MAG: insulinase family protein [Tannerellaceae bacterium]|nr:insulinase family protein [Tannerellaceae bacterium]
MKRILSFFLTSWLCLFCITFAYAQEELQPLPIDPKLRYGKLDNGLTYYIRQNSQIRERADFYIVQNVGSILEEENQRGLAHFLEHMAFDGTENFPGDAMDEYTENIGIRMGENMNAYTSFDETIYMIMNAPVTREGIIDSCLLILHDWSNFITLADSAIEKERGVIREEWRTRQDAQARLWEQQLPKMYPDSRYANRLPIGSIDVINNFQPDQLRDYYKKWYRPDLQAIIIVGDIDAEEIENKVQALFADIPAPVNPVEREWFPVPDNEAPLVSIATDPEAANVILYIFYKHEILPEEYRATIAGMVNHYLQSVTATMMNERFGELVLQADPPFIVAQSFDGDYMISKTKGAWTVAALVEEDKIGMALSTLVMETERARQFGFTEAKYERARINLLKDYESAFNERENQKNSAYTNEYVDHFTNGGYIPRIELEYNLMTQVAPAISLEDVNGFFRDLISDENIVISLTAPEKEQQALPSEQELLAMFLTAHEIEVTPYEETLSDEPLTPTLPEPGKIIESIVDPHFGATILKLSNGITVVLKQTEFRKDEILMTATSPGGSTSFGDEDIYNLKVFNEVIALGGLGNFSSTDLRKVLAGKKASASVSLGLNNENVNGAASPADLKTLFELIYLNFTAPRMDEEAYASYVARIIPQLRNADLDPMVSFSDSLTNIVYNYNPRAQRLEPEDFEKISYARIMEMYKERYADASDFVFTFVGNLEATDILPYIEQYLATLPSTGRVEEGNIAHVPQIRKGTYSTLFHRSMETEKAAVFYFYSGQMDYNLENIITGNMLKQILDLVYTEKVRKDESGTYGVYSSVRISSFPEGETTLQTYFDTDPECRETLATIIQSELEKIANEGPRIEDFNKTKENILKRYDENTQENSYWLSVLDNYYYRNFDSSTQYKTILESITPARIQAFAKELLDQGNRIEIIMEP